MHRYCLADDRLLEAVKFLDLGDGAGWELLQVSCNMKVLLHIFIFFMSSRNVNLPKTWSRKVLASTGG